MKRPAYPKYKESGVPWLGEVPEGWEVKGLRHVCRLAYGGSLAAEGREEGGVGVYGSNGQVGTHVLANTQAPVIVVGRKGSFGKLNYSKVPVYAIDTTYFIDPSCTKNNLCWLNYALLTLRLDQTSKDSAVPGLAREDAYQNKVPVPSPTEQTAIADFLDRETGRIDTLVAKKRALIGLLKEKRTALISSTVTRGLPADVAREFDLEPHTRFKDSGVEWLGEVPEGWEVRRFSREVTIAEGQVDPEREPYASMVLIGPEHVESGTGRLLQQATAIDQAAESGKYFSRKGDVIYSKIRPALRKLVIAPEDCLCSADMYPLRGIKRVENKFIYWLFLSEQFSAWSVLEADRVAMPKINRNTLNGLRMPVPPLSEQVAIATYLDRETPRLDKLVEKVESAITCLQAYRSALITAAVTGKIDVRSDRPTYIKEAC